MDKNFDGVLTKDEIIEGLKLMHYDDPEDECDRIFEIADANHDGTI